MKIRIIIVETSQKTVYADRKFLGVMSLLVFCFFCGMTKFYVVFVIAGAPYWFC